MPGRLRFRLIVGFVVDPAGSVMADSSPLPPEPGEQDGLWGASPPWWADEPAAPSAGPAVTTGPVALVAEPPPVPAPRPAPESAPVAVSAPVTAPATEPAPVSEPGPASEPVGASASGSAPAPAAADGSVPGVRRRAPLYGALVAAAVVVVLGGGTAAVLAGGGDKPPAIVPAPATAAGLARSTDLPQAAVTYPFATAALRAAGIERAPIVAALYGTGARQVLVLAGDDVVGDPPVFLRRARPATVLAARRAGTMTCGTFAVLAETRPYCAWATASTYGFVAAEDAGAGDLTGVAARLRAALETSG
jgi:hypothetical protein